MGNYKEDRTPEGKVHHYSVGAMIERDGQYLIMDRTNPPYGFAGIAGHVDEGEEADKAILREVTEESGLEVISCELLFDEEVPWNPCKQGEDVEHHWRLYRCETRGEISASGEAKSMGWYSKDEVKKLQLESVWDYWFKKLGII